MFITAEDNFPLKYDHITFASGTARMDTSDSQLDIFNSNLYTLLLCFPLQNNYGEGSDLRSENAVGCKSAKH